MPGPPALLLAQVLDDRVQRNAVGAKNEEGLQRRDLPAQAVEGARVYEASAVEVEQSLALTRHRLYPHAPPHRLEDEFPGLCARTDVDVSKLTMAYFKI